MLYPFTKQKTNIFKAILPFVIILHHIANETRGGADICQWINALPVAECAMYIFFAISGYGLVWQAEHRKDYLNGFLKSHFQKLFIPYFITLGIFCLVAIFIGFDAFFKTSVVVPASIVDRVLGFVPASWFIYVLALFYLFFYISFSLPVNNNVVKLIALSAMVFGYYIVARQVGWYGWRWVRCPAFVVGIWAAHYDDLIRKALNIPSAIAISIVLAGVALSMKYVHPALVYYTPPIIYTIIILLLCSCLPSLKADPGIVKFFSSISMEMYICQGLPLYIALALSRCNPVVCVSVTLIADILLAVLIHKMSSLLQKKISQL